MGGKINYTLVGLFIVVLAIAGMSIFFWLGLNKHAHDYQRYAVYLQEDVSGLSVESQVRFNGVPVGFVRSIELVPSNSQLVRVLIDLQSSTPVNTSTYATLVTQGITGVEYLGLKSSKINAPPLVAHSGQEYPVISSRPSLFVQLSEVLPKLTTQVTKLSQNIGRVFDAKNRESLANSLANMQNFTKTLSANSKNINDSIESMRKILKNGEAISSEMPEVLKHTKQTMIAVDSSARAFDRVANSAMNAMSDTQVAINHVSQQLLPVAQEVLRHISDMSASLNSVSSELRRNPAMFIRGRQPTALGPGEN